MALQTQTLRTVARIISSVETREKAGFLLRRLFAVALAHINKARIDRVGQ